MMSVDAPDMEALALDEHPVRRDAHRAERFHRNLQALALIFSLTDQKAVGDPGVRQHRARQTKPGKTMTSFIPEDSSPL